MHAQQVGRTPVEVLVPQPPAPIRALGRLHLVYEIHLTNFGGNPLGLETIEVRDSTQRAIASYSGAALAQRISVVGQPPTRATSGPTLAAGARAVAFMWISLDPGAAAPASLHHSLTLSGGDARRDTLRSAPVRVGPGDAPAIASPVRGGPWVAIRGPSNSSGHRLSLVTLDGGVRVPQRFAIDWAKVGADGRLYQGDSSANTAWHGYGDTVYAAAAGRVVIARDGMPDNTAFAPPSPDVVDARDAPGNVVVIAIGAGRFASYAHLASGSVRATVGDTVAEEQAIGTIGNSGNSLAPHLHFQLSDAAEVLAGEGAPFVVREFELIGRVTSLGALLAGTPWTPAAARPARTVQSEIPLENMVVRFRSP